MLEKHNLTPDSQALCTYPLVRDMPKGWKRIEDYVGIARYTHKSNLLVLSALEVHGNKEEWFHCSVSRPDRYPSWDDIMAVKNLFIGEDNEAIQVLPKKPEYVNLHKNCFHIWARRR